MHPLLRPRPSATAACSPPRRPRRAGYETTRSATSASGRWVRSGAASYHRRGPRRARGRRRHRIDCLAVLLELDRPHSGQPRPPLPPGACPSAGWTGPIRLTDPNRWTTGAGLRDDAGTPGAATWLIGPLRLTSAPHARRLRAGVGAGRRRRRHGRRTARRPDDADQRAVRDRLRGGPARPGPPARSHSPTAAPNRHWRPGDDSASSAPGSPDRTCRSRSAGRTAGRPSSTPGSRRRRSRSSSTAG